MTEIFGTIFLEEDEGRTILLELFVFFVVLRGCAVLCVVPPREIVPKLPREVVFFGTALLPPFPPPPLPPPDNIGGII